MYSISNQSILRSSCRLLRIETSVKTFGCYFLCPCASRVSSVCTEMFFSLFYFNADSQYMVKSCIWTAEKISGLNFSGVGLKTTMITSAWCSTPSTTRATCGRILCKKTTTTSNKQTKQKTIEKWQHYKKWQKWPFGRPLVRQNDEKSPILGLQLKFPETHETQIGSPPETNMFEL